MKLRGALHFHSSYSFDADVSLETIAKRCKKEGLDFICMSEHTNELDEEKFKRFVLECDRLSDQSFTLVPGLEITCDDGTHLLAYGMRHWPLSRNLDELLKSGSEALFVAAHPSKRILKRIGSGELNRLAGLELWNRKYDGLSTSRPDVHQILVKNRNLYGYAGVDFHESDDRIAPLVVLRDGSDILSALKNGAFKIVHRGVELPSDGSLTRFERIRRFFIWRIRTVIFKTLKWIKWNVVNRILGSGRRLKIESLIRSRL